VGLYHCVVFTPLVPSRPAFEQDGLPYSPRYGDIYHAAQGAVEQARHVFLAGNGLPERWRGRERFTVCETGFGLGLSFLTLWRTWRDDPRRSRRLHVVSVEAHPFSREDLADLLRNRLPADWSGMAAELLERWPPLLPGLHRLDLDGGAVTLTLAFGMAEQVVPQLVLRADAFFLDGFDPAVNPGMWSETLMRALARLAAPDATAATWTSAGAVRRALQGVGFEVERRPGFGGKRHMTAARFAPRFERRHAPAEPLSFAERHAVVVGAGIAGAGVAHALSLRGWRVTVFDPGGGGAAHGAGHLAAALTPLLARDDSPRARLTRAGALRAAARWAPWTDGDIVARCGTVQQAKSDAKEADMRTMLDALGFPADWVRAVDRAEASALAGCATARGGAYFPGGLRIRPRALCAALLSRAGIEVRSARVARIGIESDRVTEERRVYVKCDQCPPRFHLGEQAEVLITVARLAKALLIPEAAVTGFDGGKGTVWTVDGGRLKRRVVAFGHRTEDARLEVRETLPKDVAIVTLVSSTLREGDRARPVRERAP